jgi:dsRNA-specific ribonuclease
MVSKSIMQFNVKLSEAKLAIGIPTFKRDNILIIALTDPSTLDCPKISVYERENRKRQYRRLALLGDALFDAVLIDYLFEVNSELTKEDIDDWRQEVASRESLTEFAIDLGLPEFSSSWNKKNRKSPEEEPGLWGEMFEAVVGAIFLNRDRDFSQLSGWLQNRFIRPAIGSQVGDEDYDTYYDDSDTYYTKHDL